MWDINLSVIEHLREAAFKLELTQDDGALDIYELDESEIASIINQYYQDEKIKNRTNLEKRKHQQEGDQDNKKFKPELKVFPKLSALEQLPNEIYEKILYPLRAEDKNNLRTTCKGLYEKTTIMDPRYRYWCFDASKGTPPDFVLNTDKQFCVKVLFDNLANHDEIGYLINRFAHRLSSLKLDGTVNHPVMDYLRSMKPIGYPHLTALNLELESDDLDNDSLLQLAPQLVNLRIILYSLCEFDLSTVDEESRCFTKLKTLEVDCKIDIKKILTKCCTTLEFLKFDYHHSKKFEKLEDKLTALKCLDICVSNFSEKSIRNLLSKAVENLRTLKIEFMNLDGRDFEFSTLLEQDIYITTLEISPDTKKIDEFLNKCPHIQFLTISEYFGEIKDVVLKDLTRLTFDRCDAACISNVLKQFSKTLATLDIKSLFGYWNKSLDPFHYGSDTVDEPVELDYPVLLKLDTFWISGCNQDPWIMDNIPQFFAENVQVTKEESAEDTVFRRVYIIP